MKDMMHTAFFMVAFVIFFILSMLLFVPYVILKLFRMRKAFERFIFWVSTLWGHFILLICGCTLSASGLENMPGHKRIIYISNHQGYADIPFLMAMLPTTVGFIAKKELANAPFIGIWGKALHCIFIERGNIRSAMRDIERGIREAEDGYPKVIFPEGTRSKGMKMRTFKPGSIHLAAKMGLTIVPLTLNGTWKIFEEKKRIVPSRLTLLIHPPIETAGMSEDEQKELSSRLWNIIASGLPDKGE